MTRKALFVLTSHDRIGETGRPTGFYWEELALPYLELTAHGYDVEFASIEGGAAPADPGSAKEEGRPEPVARIMADADAMARIADTTPIAEVDATAYDLVYLPGGHGTMWDLAQSADLGRVLSTAWATGAVVGAVCHGPAGLLAARAEDGKPLVAGRRVNAFTDAEEVAVGLAETVPYLLETRLREQGAVFEANPQHFAAHAVRDGRLVTGQNPASTPAVTALLLEALEARAAA